MDDLTAKYIPIHIEWTAAEVETLTTMWSGGVTSRGIAAVLGKSRSAILGKLNRLGGYKRPKSPGATRSDMAIKPRSPGAERMRKWREVHRGERYIRPRAEMRQVAPVAEPRCETNVTIYELTENHCRWPLGEPAHDMLYCGGPAIKGLPYCGHHSKLAYTPTSYRGAPSAPPG